MIPSGSGSSAPFFPPPWLFNFPPCPAWKEEKEDGEEGGEKGGGEGRAGQGKQEQKTSGLGFSPTEVLHIHEQPALDRLMPKT